MERDEESSFRLGDWVDLDRYPLQARASLAYWDSVRRARRGLGTEECAYLPDFLRPDAIERMQEEARSLLPSAVYFSQEHNPYFSKVPEEAAAWDPRRKMGRKTNGLVPGDAFPRSGPIWNLCRHAAVKGFVEDCLDAKPLYFYEDPYGCLNVSVQRQGEEFAWHFDTNEFTISLLLEQPERGGVFEFAPNIRTPEDECYRDVADLLEGDRSKVVALDLKPGDLQLFKGRYSVHRVTPVEGERPRLIALFAYSRAPGMYATPERSQQIWGRVHPDQIAALEHHSRADALVD
ncbi:MAG: hypothetical protein AAFY02_05260 [Pseudomonadota bacterium]